MAHDAAQLRPCPGSIVESHVQGAIMQGSHLDELK
eukprot:CAMPEP_0206606762 /NCGR_PEP_ID=MMETSP0325_2-20121206/51616_1 /ASSEMBLY_ACC=CAM_ASM_000347 /TAXON_ID=2866 /ORGANISM="Crypthecodinium cohnii, Strain Seligo" /LENGTH=34 /DNA_ID= /DNA_START= /DNA_END= /DNA_ORIENTATION=